MAIAPTQSLTVTLEAQQWNSLMALLAEGPYRISAPLIQAIQQQCMTQSERVPTNGVGEEACGVRLP